MILLLSTICINKRFYKDCKTKPHSLRGFFTASTDVTAMIITKLDGTAKGGVVLAIANQFKIPVKYIGVGEKMNDLIVFDKHEFVDSLFNLEKNF